MRVAFVGDMNNNHFSFMRYLRDLDVDAHLFCFENANPRWIPESDTYEMNKWAPFVHTLAAGNNHRHILTRSPKKIKKQLEDFDILVGTGLAPALLSRAGLTLDFVFPYSIGFEGLKDRVRFGLLRGAIDLIRVYYQRKGLKAARYVLLTAGDKQTEHVAMKIGVTPLYMPTIPMVYNGERGPYTIEDSDHIVTDVVNRLKSCDFVVSSHVRHDWTQPVRDNLNVVYSKRTDILIHGFSQFLKRTRKKNPKLLLVEYGVDVHASKELAADLGISDAILWIPTLKRCQIMLILKHINVGGGEFTGAALTFGVFLETLAAGKPLLNYMDLDPNEYFASTGAPLPPVLHCGMAEDVCRRLLELESDPEKAEQIGAKGKAWFDQYAGIGLAMRYKELFERVADKKCIEIG